MCYAVESKAAIYTSGLLTFELNRAVVTGGSEDEFRPFPEMKTDLEPLYGPPGAQLYRWPRLNNSFILSAPNQLPPAGTFASNETRSHVRSSRDCALGSGAGSRVCRTPW